MTLPVSPNSISAGQIRTEFGASGANNSVSLGAYRVSSTVGVYSQLPLDDGIPQGTAAIGFGNFRGKSLNVVLDLGTDTDYRVNLKTKYENSSTTPDPNPLYYFDRYYNNIGYHFYTADASVEYLKENSYKLEIANYFTAYQSQVDQTTALYRAFDPLSGAHILTANFDEYNSLPDSGWQQEGRVGYVYSSSFSNAIPIYRSFNSTIGDFLFSKSYTEATTSSGYSYEGVAFYTPNSDNKSRVIVVGGYATKPTNTSGKKIRISIDNKRIGSAAGNRNYAALQTGSWDAGTELIMSVGKDGVLMGAGGDGGNGGDGGDGAAATQGTSALGIQYSTTLINNGLIFGGRGGGGGGGGSTYKRCGRNQRGCKEGRTFNLTGGGGAGGRGFPGGTGGTGGNAGTSGDGTSGTVDLNGSNGGGVFGDGTSAGWNGTSGAGGTPGTKGENGQGPGGSTGGSGGDRGYAIIINSGVILSKSDGTGTIDGDEVTGTPT